MKRYYGSQQNLTKPVEKISLDDRTVSKRRIFLIALFFCIGIGAFIYAFTHLSGNEKGWSTVVLDNVYDKSCYYDFSLLYQFGVSGKRVNKEKKALRECYGQLAGDAYKIFDRREEYSGISNLCTINRNPNEEVSVDPALYHALQICVRDGGRLLYLGALTEHMEALISSDSAEALFETDPYTNPEVKAFFQKTASYASDSDSVSLELLGDSRVILHVSQEYLSFAKENAIVDFIDFGWARNAVIIDYLADGLREAGFKQGILSSYDGFTRNFCDGDSSFDYKLILGTDGEIENAGTMQYQGLMSFVWFHDYAVNSFDRLSRVLELTDGKRRTTYLGPDGMPLSALRDMLLWSDRLSCAETALVMAKYYISEKYYGDGFRAEAGQRGISVLTAEEEGKLCTNDWNVTFSGNNRTVVRFPYSPE